METLTSYAQATAGRPSSDDSVKMGAVIEAPALGQSEGIHFRAVDCRKRFEHSIQILKEISPSEALNQQFDRDSSLFTIRETFAHYKAWGNNIAAFQNVMIRSSLEFRLREATEIQQRVLKILANLQVSLYEAALIITGKEPNESWPAEEHSDSDNEEPDSKPEQTSELQELFKAMRDANTNLLKLSMVIRNSPDRDDYLKAATRYGFDASYDIGHVREKHGSAKNSADWLIVRLGKAITRRRQYLKYRNDHHGKLTRDWDDVMINEEEDKTIALTKATTFVENTTAVQTHGSDLGGSFGSQTSYEATTMGESTGVLNVPSHPKMGFEDVPFQFGSPFQCPYCLTEQVVKNRSAWKRHVFRDLKPYVCTFKGCDQRMFSSRNEWFAHELQNHRREWACQQCQHAPFSSSSAYEVHLNSCHQVELKGSQLKALLLQSEEPVDKVSATACRLCDQWETNIEDKEYDYKRLFPDKGQPSQSHGTSRQFRRHLGRHMEQLALFALPMNEDAMEDNSLSEEEHYEESSASVVKSTEIGNGGLIDTWSPGLPVDSGVAPRELEVPTNSIEVELDDTAPSGRDPGWTQVSDLAESARLQNRIKQGVYRELEPEFEAKYNVRFSDPIRPEDITYATRKNGELELSKEELHTAYSKSSPSYHDGLDSTEDEFGNDAQIKTHTDHPEVNADDAKNRNLAHLWPENSAESVLPTCERCGKSLTKCDGKKPCGSCVSMGRSEEECLYKPQAESANTTIDINTLRKERMNCVIECSNRAVEHDTNQDYAAAKEAYLETSRLLEACLDSNSTEEDREKISGIKKAYDSRLQVLRELTGDRDYHDT
ncbi:putative ankyrin repeat protein [Botrytis fragariae]|uniref:Putative ankyrin repeat protein n=1 Tax=Botrytis fragariae TaxID=1964551 RepID=A0A8H6B520_9HELO|nr:putative ankyrin repeat protein [Botrytis fragariae]KAF5879364.1 putative ankyrin repeat protein [Botrytis fragariae]